jgi:hypothetical protein
MIGYGVPLNRRRVTGPGLAAEGRSRQEELGGGAETGVPDNVAVTELF